MNTLFERLTRLNWKIFFIGFLIGMVVVFLLNLNKNNNASPLGNNIKHTDFKLLTQKLSQKRNDFKLKSPNQELVSQAFANDFDIYAAAYVVVNLDNGEILAEKNSEVALPIASLTKVMTGVVALDLARPDELFTISEYAANKPATKLGIITGEKMYLWELLNAALLTSANDASQVIEDGINQKYNNSDVFEWAMNEKARVLGLKSSSFSNPQGFDSRKNYSTASDFAVLSGYALTNYPIISEIVKKDYEFLPADNNHKQFDLYNWNGLLGVYPNVYGIKIGNTDDAQFTTTVVSEREGKKVLVVLLGAPGALERDLWAGALLDIGFEKLGLSKIEITEAQLLEKYSTWRYWN